MQLMFRGWACMDPDENGDYHRQDFNWWCSDEEEGLLSLHHESGWSATIATDKDRKVLDVTLWYETYKAKEPTHLASFEHWPGTDEVIAIADTLMRTLPAPEPAENN